MMLRDSSEELLVRSLVDGQSVTPGAGGGGLESGMGHLNNSSSLRVNSEELFNSWISNSENPLARHHGRIPTELAALLAQQQQQPSDPVSYQYQNDHKRTTSGSEGRRAQQEHEYPSLQTLSWFQPSQPMTRSRSTELRRKYLEMQKQASEHGFSFVCESQIPTEHSFLPWPDNLNQGQMVDQVSSVSTVVSMLKGTLEKKKMTAKRSLNFIDELNNNNMDGNYMFKVHTPSESSNGGDNSCPATPIHLFHDQQTGRAIICAGAGEVQAEEQKKQAQLSRAGSITSSGRSAMNAEASSDVSTKKRRVERKRMMVEAKGRSSAPPMPADMQAAIKRSEALEKEVRSLKLNLSFMNRKDSEQTKRIEELEKQNEELLREKSRLTEELDQLIS